VSTKHASTTLTLVETPTETVCPAFCLRHDPGVDELCIGPTIELDFGPADPGNRDVTHHVRILSFSEPDAGVTLSLVVNGSSNCDLTTMQARQIAAALVQAADATEAGAR
jgi:hypothetical protein